MKLRDSLLEAKNLLDICINDDELMLSVEKSIETFSSCILKGGKIISCGNGGSMSDAMHFAEELSGNFRKKRKAIAALSISDPSHISCVANDYGYDFIFSRYIEAIGNKGDCLLAISTSGNSKNVIEAAKSAKEKSITVIALTANTGGALARLADIEIRIPFNGYSDRIQEMHIKVIHALIAGIESQCV